MRAAILAILAVGLLVALPVAESAEFRCLVYDPDCPAHGPEQCNQQRCLVESPIDIPLDD